MKTDKLNISLFLIILFLLGAFNIFAPDKPAVSVLENRKLKNRPEISLKTLFNGELSRDYEDYFSDNFLFRESLVRISNKLGSFRGLPIKTRAYVINHGGANIAQGKEGDKTAFSKGSILVIDDKAMELHHFNRENGKLYAQSLNHFASKLPDNVKTYSLLIPTQIEFIKDRIYRALSSPQQETISEINKHLSPEVFPVNAYDILKDHSDEYIYFRTDHHWTSLGAYYAYREFVSARGDEPIPLDIYDTMEIEGFLGTTYRIVLDSGLEKNPDTVILYKPFINQEYQVFYDEAVTLDLLDMSYAEQNGKYGIFLGGDHPLGRIQTAVKNGKSIAIIKDSYGNAFIPFLLPHYQDIYIIDPRTFEGNAIEYIKNEGIEEVLFLNYVLASDNENYTDHLNRIAGY